MITFKARTKNGILVNSFFSSMQFPAGETYLKTDPKGGLRDHEVAIAQFTPASMHADLFTIEMWARKAHLMGVKKLTLVMPYLPGARADKTDEPGALNYAWFIGQLGIDKIITLDPHSDYWLEKYDRVRYIRHQEPRAYEVLMPEDIIPHEFFAFSYDGIIAPDKGAIHRADGVAKALDMPIYYATKERDFETGKLSGFTPPADLPTGDYLIVDDICDGGGTFMGLSHAISSKYPDVTLDLYVSHGVFSGEAYIRLPRYFHSIYTTNSLETTKHFASVPTSPFKVLDVLPMLLDRVS